ncbi:MAG: winged helix-turn-helix transcriptional regulator [Acidilobaceae archaeon]
MSLELDDRDKAIIETLREQGEATVAELQQKTGIPKTPLYRRLKKLEEMGLIEPRETGGARKYRLKSDKRES